MVFHACASAAAYAVNRAAEYLSMHPLPRRLGMLENLRQRCTLFAMRILQDRSGNYSEMQLILRGIQNLPLGILAVLVCPPTAVQDSYTFTTARIVLLTWGITLSRIYSPMLVRDARGELYAAYPEETDDPEPIHVLWAQIRCQIAFTKQIFELRYAYICPCVPDRDPILTQIRCPSSREPVLMPAWNPQNNRIYELHNYMTLIRDASRSYTEQGARPSLSSLGVPIGLQLIIEHRLHFLYRQNLQRLPYELAEELISFRYIHARTLNAVQPLEPRARLEHPWFKELIEIGRRLRELLSSEQSPLAPINEVRYIEELTEVQSVSDSSAYRAIPMAFKLDPTLRKWLCPILQNRAPSNLSTELASSTLPPLSLEEFSSGSIRYIVRVKGTEDCPVYYDQRALSEWMTQYPKRPPHNWPNQIPYAADQVEPDASIQSQIDRRLQELQKAFTEDLRRFDLSQI